MRTGIAGSDSLNLPVKGIKRTGEVKDFSPKQFIPAMKARRMSRFSQLALASAVEAMRDSGYEMNDENRYRTAVIVGTGLASTDSTDRFYEGLLREGPEGTNPMVFPETVQNIAAAHISMHFNASGYNTTFSHADISSELALFFACELLKDRQADMVIVTGAEELSASEIYGYASLGVLSNSMHCFGRKRDGFVLAEGAATLILERADDAERRGADIRCLVGSVGIASSPALNTDYAGSADPMMRAMSAASAEACIQEPDAIFAASNSTKGLDLLEAEAIRTAFGSAMPVTALRSYYGYFQADGMLRIAMAALCMRHGILPATVGTDMTFDGCGIDVVLKEMRLTELNSVMINSFSIGGGAASVLLRKI